MGMVTGQGMYLLSTALAILVLSVMIIGLLIHLLGLFAGSLDLTLVSKQHNHFLGMCQTNLPWMMFFVPGMKTPFNSVHILLQTTVTPMRVQA